MFGCNTKKASIAVLVVVVTLTSICFAEIDSLESAVGYYGNFLTTLTGLVIQITRIAVVFVFCIFLYNIMRFVMAADAKEKNSRKSKMFFDAVALFILTSVWGIAAFYSAIILGDTTTTSNPSKLIQIGQ